MRPLNPSLRRLACLVALLGLLLSSLPARVAAQTPACGYQPLVAAMLSQTSQPGWAAWIARLSGETPVQIGGQSATIVSRHTQRMFSGDPQARAFEYVLEQLTGWLGGRARFEEAPYLVYRPPEEIYNAKNLVVEIPGATHPEEIVVLSAHLDSLADKVTTAAPGADDNASGVAALLEAARIFRRYRFARSIRLMFFTGEEQFELGSRAYLAKHPPTGVVGVFNLDMIAYDQDQDHCIELHAAGPAGSRALAACVQDSISAYRLDLQTEIVLAGASIESDHSSFWAYNIPAVLLWENTTTPEQNGKCTGTDLNAFYHTANDRLERLNLATGFAAAQAGIAAAAGLAQPLALCQAELCGPQPETGAIEFWQRWVASVRRVP